MKEKKKDLKKKKSQNKLDELENLPSLDKIIWEDQIRRGCTNMDFETWSLTIRLTNKLIECPHCKEKEALGVNNWSLNYPGKQTWFVRCRYCDEISEVILEIYKIRKMK